MISLPTIFFDFDRPFGDFERRMVERSKSSAERFSPPSEFYETDTHFVFSFDLPGIDRAALNVELQDDELRISGERKSLLSEVSGKRYFSERRYGKFRRVYALPPGVKAEDISAQFENGVLTVSVPKPLKPGPAVIPVAGESGAGGG